MIYRTRALTASSVKAAGTYSTRAMLDSEHEAVFRSRAYSPADRKVIERHGIAGLIANLPAQEARECIAAHREIPGPRLIRKREQAIVRLHAPLRRRPPSRVIYL